MNNRERIDLDRYLTTPPDELDEDELEIKIMELEEKGITVIVVPDEYDGHRRKTRKTRGRRNIT